MQWIENGIRSKGGTRRDGRKEENSDGRELVGYLLASRHGM